MSALRIIKVIVVSLQRCVLDKKVTLRTVCGYDQYLRTLFMERHPVITLSVVSMKLFSAHKMAGEMKHYILSQ